WPRIQSRGFGRIGSTKTRIVPPHGIPVPSTSSLRSRSIIAVSPVSRPSSALCETAPSAQPPPTQPARIRPSRPITALEPVFAETEPCVSMTVASTNGSLRSRGASMASSTSREAKEGGDAAKSQTSLGATGAPSLFSEMSSLGDGCNGEALPVPAAQDRFANLRWRKDAGAGAFQYLSSSQDSGARRGPTEAQELEVHHAELRRSRARPARCG